MLGDLDAWIDGTSLRRSLATVPVSAGQVLYGSADGLSPASSLFPTCTNRLAGIAETGATAGQEFITVTNGLWRGTTPWPVGSPLFLGPDGFPTLDPATGLVCVPVGHVHGPGVIHVRIGLPIIHGGS